MDNKSEELSWADLHSLSDFGTIQGVREYLENRKKRCKSGFDLQEVPQPTAKNRKGRRGTPVIIVPEEDCLYETSRGRGQIILDELARTNNHQPFMYDKRRSELKEIGSAGLRNDSIEGFFHARIGESKTNIYDDEEDDENGDSDIVEKEQVPEKKVETTEMKPSTPRKKKDRKSKNALLNSLKSKLDAQQKDVKIESTVKASDTESEACISEFIVDDSVDKLNVDEKLISQLLDNVQIDSVECSGEYSHPIFDETTSDDEFFSASGLSSSSVEYLTASSRKSTPVDSSSECRSKKRYHGTSRRGLSENSIGFLSPTYSGTGKKKIEEKVKKKGDDPKPENAYYYDPFIFNNNCGFTYRKSDFPPLKSP